jgi:hypothetical protein
MRHAARRLAFEPPTKGFGRTGVRLKPLCDSASAFNGAGRTDIQSSGSGAGFI